MPNPTAELLERIEKATESSYELDRAIARLIDWPEETNGLPVYNYTASLDAALSLVDRLGFGKWWRLGRGQVTAYHCEIRVYGGGAEYLSFHGQGRNGATAILAALLRAIQQKDNEHD